MARGWESKSVESQREDAELNREATRKLEQSAQDAELGRKRDTLTLSRKRVVRDLETSKSTLHRTSLTAALDFLDKELAKIEAALPPKSVHS